MNIRENLKAYLDGELSPADAKLVEQAIESDPELQKEIQEMSRLSSAIKAFSHEFRAQGQQATLDAVTAKAKPGFWQRPLTWAIGVPILAALLIVASPAVSRQGLLNVTMAPAEAVESAPMAKAAPAEYSADKAPALHDQFKAESKPSRPQNGAGFGSVAAGEDYGGATAAPSQGANLPLLEQGNVGRMIVKSGNLDVLVPDLVQAGTEVPKIAKTFGGYVESSSANNIRGQRQANYTVKVAAQHFDRAMDALGNLGEVTTSSSSGDDVTAEVADIDARIKVMKAEEEQYEVVLKGARTIGQILEVKRQLSRVRQEIESLTAQSTSLKNLASLSTIGVTLTEHAQPIQQVPQDWFGETWTNAKNALSNFGVFLGRILVYVGTFSVVWVPALVIYLWLKRRNKPTP